MVCPGECPWAPEKNMYYSIVGWSISCAPVKSIWFFVLFRCSISLLIFFLFVLFFYLKCGIYTSNYYCWTHYSSFSLWQFYFKKFFIFQRTSSFDKSHNKNIFIIHFNMNIYYFLKSNPDNRVSPKKEENKIWTMYLGNIEERTLLD